MLDGRAVLTIGSSSHSASPFPCVMGPLLAWGDMRPRSDQNGRGPSKRLDMPFLCYMYVSGWDSGTWRLTAAEPSFNDY